MPRWLVDGMNVIGSRPDGWWRDRPGAMRRLAQRLSDWAAETGDEVTVVLDGRRVELGDHPGIEVLFASEHGEHGRDAADRVITRLAAEVDERSDLVAVTSDSELADQLRSLGVRVEGAGRFAA
jgi:predicted RNA-binding protein with PIN domain